MDGACRLSELSGKWQLVPQESCRALSGSDDQTSDRAIINLLFVFKKLIRNFLKPLALLTQVRYYKL